MTLLSTSKGPVKRGSRVFTADGAHVGRVEEIDPVGGRFRIGTATWLHQGSVAAANPGYVLLSVRRYQLANSEDAGRMRPPPGHGGRGGFLEAE